MFKQGLLLILLSAIAIFFKKELAHVLQWLVWAHNKVATWLGVIFSNDSAGQIILGILVLIIIPLAIALVIALIYWLFKRKMAPQFMSIVWLVWTVLLVTMLAQMG